MEPPIPPNESDCCNSGCNPCILDVYQDQLKKYNEFCKNSNTFQNSEVINCIDLTSYTIFKLIETTQLSSTVFLLKFQYANSKEKAPNCFKCEPGQYLLLQGKDYDGEFTRAYTPIPIENESNLSFIILVRIYPTGRMSTILKKMRIGYESFWRGPYGNFVIDYKYKYMFFVAQGTGIAPVFAVIKKIVHDEECQSFIKLFFCCRDSNDILLREQLYELSSFWNFSYEIFLSKSDNLIILKYNEIVHSEKLTSLDLHNYIDGKSRQLRAIICGSDKFNENIKSQIEKMGVETNHICLF